MEKTIVGKNLQQTGKSTFANRGTAKHSQHKTKVSKDQHVDKRKFTKEKHVEKRNNSIVVKRGDVFFADLGQKGSNVGSEQSGVRPVVILQNDVGNKFSTTVIIACITSQIDKAKLPTHVEVGVKNGLKKESVVLLEQIRTIDKQRLTDKVTNFDDEVMDEINKAMMISLGLA